MMTEAIMYFIVEVAKLKIDDYKIPNQCEEGYNNVGKSVLETLGLKK